MKRHVKFLALVVVSAVAISVGVLAYYLALPRVSLMVYRDSNVTGTKARMNETVTLHVKNIGTVDLSLNACAIRHALGSIHVNYMFQIDLLIPVGVEAIISFPACGG